MNSREQTPDWIKGVAIVLMVYGHITHIGSWATWQKQAVEFIYTFHMPLFLMMSGYFFKASDLDPGAAFQRLCKRLVLPYVVFLSLYLVGLVVIQRFGIHTANLPPQSMFDFVRIVLVNPRGAYWFIHTLIVIQLSFIAARSITLHLVPRNTLFWPMACALLVLACVVGLCGPRTVVFFAVGLLLRQLNLALPSSITFGALGVGLIGWLSATGIYVFSVAQVLWCLAILALLAGVGRAWQGSRTVAMFAWLGRNSLPVLVLHALFIVLMKPVSNWSLRLEPSGTVYSLLVTAATIAGCLGVALLLDWIKLSQYTFGVQAVYSPRRTA